MAHGNLTPLEIRDLEVKYKTH